MKVESPISFKIRRLTSGKYAEVKIQAQGVEINLGLFSKQELDDLSITLFQYAEDAKEQRDKL